jgi:hypothetical protein
MKLVAMTSRDRFRPTSLPLLVIRRRVVDLPAAVPPRPRLDPPYTNAGR